MAWQSNYWSCSKFADWLRGTPKPSAETSKGWHVWNKDAKEKHPFRYWLAEECLNNIQDFITWPSRKVNDIRYYINNRWITRSNSLTAHPKDIKPGQWQDVGYRILPCLFNELVDFVEIEQAWFHCVWDDETQKKYNYPWWRKWYRKWRSPEAGLAYLDWAASLKLDDEWVSKDHPDYGKPTQQALAAMEIKELYLWWTQVYRNRPDPYDASGWSELCEKRRITHGEDGIFFEDRTDDEKEQSKQTLASLHDLEAVYEQEDEDMLIRLIKIRKSLWT